MPWLLKMGFAAMVGAIMWRAGHDPMQPLPQLLAALTISVLFVHSVIAIGWIVLICILFLLPLFPDGIPGNSAVVGSHFLLNVNWIDVNYAPLTVGGWLLFCGGWWLISAKNWFKGPIRMGSEEELERIEAEFASGD